MAKTQVRTILIGAGLTILLAGCAQLDLTPQASSSPQNSPQAAPSSSPLDTPSPASTLPPTTVADLVVAPEGLGPILLGSAPGESGLLSYDPAWCLPPEKSGRDGYTPGDPDAGRWYQSFDPSPGALTAFGVILSVDDGTIAFIDIRDDSIRTAKGIGLGSTLDELTAAYPDLKSQIPGDISTIYYITTDKGRISFEVPTESTVDQAGEVQVLTINLANQEQVSSWYMTDAGALTCF